MALLASEEKVDLWYKEESSVYKNYAYIYQNPIWNRPIPKGATVCRFWQNSWFIGFFGLKCFLVPTFLLLRFLGSTITSLFGRSSTFINSSIGNVVGKRIFTERMHEWCMSDKIYTVLAIIGFCLCWLVVETVPFVFSIGTAIHSTCVASPIVGLWMGYYAVTVAYGISLIFRGPSPAKDRYTTAVFYLLISPMLFAICKSIYDNRYDIYVNYRKSIEELMSIISWCFSTLVWAFAKLLLMAPYMVIIGTVGYYGLCWRDRRKKRLEEILVAPHRVRALLLSAMYNDANSGVVPDLRLRLKRKLSKTFTSEMGILMAKLYAKDVVDKEMFLLYGNAVNTLLQIDNRLFTLTTKQYDELMDVFRCSEDCYFQTDYLVSALNRFVGHSVPEQMKILKEATYKLVRPFHNHRDSYFRPSTILKAVDYTTLVNTARAGIPAWMAKQEAEMAKENTPPQLTRFQYFTNILQNRSAAVATAGSRICRTTARRIANPVKQVWTYLTISYAYLKVLAKAKKEGWCPYKEFTK